MCEDRLTDTEKVKLDKLVRSKKFLNENLDRLIAWEIWQNFCFGKWNSEVQNKDFCDKMGVHSLYTYRVIDRVKEKAEKYIKNLTK